MSDTAEELRRNLAALRLERGTPGPAPRGRRPLVWGVAAVVAALVLVAVGRRLFVGRPLEVELVTARRAAAAAASDGVPVLSGAGYVVSAERYIAIGVRVAGRIERYLVEEGDRVQKGDALVQLDARDYEAAVRHAEATLRQAKATAALKETQLTRARKLAGEGVVSQDELDLRAAEAESGAAAVGQADAQLAQARVALEYTTLRAPTSGVVLAKLKEVGEIAVPGGFAGSGDLIRVANLEDLRGQVDVTESELAKIRLGQRAAVVPDAFPDKRYRARVVKLYPQVDRQKGTLRVEVGIEEPDEALWPDMSARITFLEPVAVAADGQPAVLVPRGALRGEGAAAYVWVVEDRRARKRPVVIGKEFGDDVQVASGLQGDEALVVGDRLPLTDGQPVTVVTGR